MSRSNSMLR